MFLTITLSHNKYIQSCGRMLYCFSLICSYLNVSFSVIDDAEQHQYEEWLLHTQQLLQMQLKFLEEQIGVHRKSRKALCAKQRTAKKAGREFVEAEKLKLITEEQSKIQKQLDQVCKNS